MTPSPPNENRDGPDTDIGLICASAAEADAKIEAVLSIETAFDHILSPSGLEPVLAARLSDERANANSFYDNGLWRVSENLSSILPLDTRVLR
jgi:hypothetical protein